MLALRLQESRPERGDPHHGVFHCALQAHRCFDHRRVTRDAKRRAVNFPSFALARAGIAHRHVDFLPPVARARQLHKHTLGLSSPLFARVAGRCSSRQSTRFFPTLPTFTRYFPRGPQGRGTSAFFSASGTCPSFDCVRSRFGPRCSGRPKAGGGSRPSIHCPREDGPCPGKVVRTKTRQKNSLDSRRTWRTDAPLTFPTHPSSWSADGTDNASLVQALRDNEIVTSESVESAMRRESPDPLSLSLSLSLVSLYGLFLTRFVPLVPPFCLFS